MTQLKSYICIGVMAGAIGLLAGGCPNTSSRLANQGGGNLVTAASKVVGGKISDLTPDEIQVVTDFAIAQAGVTIDPVPDDAAAAVVEFIQENNLNTIQDVQNLVNDPGNVVITPDVLNVLSAFATGEAANLQSQGASAQANP